MIRILKNSKNACFRDLIFLGYPKTYRYVMRFL